MNWWRNTEWWMIILTGAVAFFAGVSAWIFYLQLAEMHRTAILDQRAWVSLSVAWQPLIENSHLKAIIRVVNTGKTPASGVHHDFVVEKVSNSRSPTLVYSKTDPPHMATDIGLLIPNAPGNIDLMMYRRKEKETVPYILTRTDIDELNRGKAYVAVFAKTTYFDIYGIPHWLHFCVWHAFSSGNFDARACTEYNEIDKNPN